MSSAYRCLGATIATSAGSVRLDEFDKDEWRDVARKLRPDWSEDDFEQAWTEFCRDKLRRRTN